MAPPSPRVKSDPSREGMREYAFQDLPQVVENLEEGMLKLSNFPVAGRLRYFVRCLELHYKRPLGPRDRYALPFIRRAELCEAPLETPLPSTPEKRTAPRDGYALPFIRRAELYETPLETPLPSTPEKRMALWQEIGSLLD